MQPGDGSEPITDDELLYRRVPAGVRWYDPAAKPPLTPVAFTPRDDDVTGLSLFRAKYKSIEEAARGRSKKGYYIAVLRAGDLQARGIEVLPAPLPGDPGHCEIPGLAHGHRNTDLAKEWMQRLARELCLRVEGPFPGATESSS